MNFLTDTSKQTVLQLKNARSHFIIMTSSVGDQDEQNPAL